MPKSFIINNIRLTLAGDFQVIASRILCAVNQAGEATSGSAGLARPKFTTDQVPGALTMRRLISAVLAAALLAACSESPTSPASTASDQRPSLSVSLPGTSITINSASCSLVSSTEGDVLCSYSVSNPDGLPMDVAPHARVDIAFQCVNASNGRVMSTGTQLRFVEQEHLGVTATTYSATNEALPTAELLITKLCKGKQTAIVTGYSMPIWWLSVESSGNSVCVSNPEATLGCKTL